MILLVQNQTADNPPPSIKIVKLLNRIYQNKDAAARTGPPMAVVTGQGFEPGLLDAPVSAGHCGSEAISAALVLSLSGPLKDAQDALGTRTTRA